MAARCIHGVFVFMKAAARPLAAPVLSFVGFAPPVSTAAASN
jgi:hypothetical protein